MYWVQYKVLGMPTLFLPSKILFSRFSFFQHHHFTKGGFPNYLPSCCQAG